MKAHLKSKVQHKRGRRRNVFIPSTLTVSTLASVLKIKLEHLLSKMKRVGMTEEARYDYILNSDYASLLADELGFNPIVDDEAAFDIHPPPPHPNPSSLPSRPPIVTIMGHVDHGKTTLLDTLRSAAVAKGEAGGITQHIGAFSVPVKIGQGANPNSGSQTITFLDTPGHAAFSAMRARGADVTDIIVLVVAADDGIMPQTKEVINLLKKEEAQMNLVVAINKVDKPGVDIDAVKKALMAEGIQLEEFGGDIPAVHVSGLTGQGLPELIETLSAVAEMQDLRAENDGPVYGHVLESNLNKGLGPVATVLVQSGCLKRGSQIISGLSHGKVRVMTDSKGAPVQKAFPGQAVIVSGWKSLPKAGDEVLEGSDADIKKALCNRIRKADANTMQQDIEAINTARGQEHDAREEGAVYPVSDAPLGPKQLKLYIKADVSGSGEALEGALNGIGNHVAVSKVIGNGVGDITESDVMRAHAAKATIIGFSVTIPRAIRTMAAQNAVPIFTSDIIYRLIDDVRGSLISMLPTIKETKVIGEADVLEIFDIQLKGGKTMKVAGCRVINGIIEKQKSVRVVRSGETIHEGSLDTMRQLKKDIIEARKGVECGLSLKDFSDIKGGDLIQMVETIEKPGVL
ncbi:initiation factor 2 [Pholiota conissans]|uniref:Translation initiation factor IF-2, mitochondrial n=1 Tax=Pholiota conissans TaxID=109636 RepID=A0A9P5ZA06_9AGAR|nr:initiation factor 2 [Pholiota conissans]